VIEPIAAASSLMEQLAQLLGAAQVLTSPTELDFFSSDIYTRGATAEAVIAPGTVEDLAAAVQLCTQAGRIVIPRGGGLSYTSGYVPVQSRSIVVDLRRLNRIVEINAEDMYVTVECGATWKDLYDALKARGLRTPYFGPVSGFSSTVGGALSQGSFFLGSTQYGTTAETALGLEVVLADGSILKTGSAGSLFAPSPFFRTYGPDLTALFLGDTGAFGFKARATLRLIPFPDRHRYASYEFADITPALSALTQIARRGLAAEAYVWDPYVVQKFADSGMDFARDIAYLKGVVESGDGLLRGLKDAARIALSGKDFARDGMYLLHVTVDETSDTIADEKIEAVRGVAAQQGGTETEPSIPRALRGTPFSYPNGILGSKGERWVPTNALCPHSRALKVWGALNGFMEKQAGVIRQHGIKWGTILFAVGNNTVCLEPLFYWPDRPMAYHRRMIEPDYLAKLPEQPDNPAATAAMRALRAGLTDLFMREGCVHVQIGKTYRFLESRDPVTRRVIERLKAAVDPGGRVNPGSLGLAADIERELDAGGR
jgi:FAD/FMN-containing dehydrogenase